MKRHFRSQLSNPDLLSRLLETADRSGAYADAETYGRGLMDLGAATSPVGESSVALGKRVEDAGASLQSTRLNPSSALGDAFATSLVDREIAAFDELGAPFWYDVGDLAPSAARPSLAARLHEFQSSSIAGPPRSPSDAIAFPLLDSPAGWQDTTPTLHLARYGASAAARTSHFALAGQGLVATLPVSPGLSATRVHPRRRSRGGSPRRGAAFTWRIPQSSFGLRAGWMGEGETVLGTGSDGAFGSLLADSVFAGIEAGRSLGPWRVGGNAEVGTVRARARNGMFGELSPPGDQRLRVACHPAVPGRRRVPGIALAAPAGGGRPHAAQHPFGPHHRRRSAPPHGGRGVSSQVAGRWTWRCNGSSPWRSGPCAWARRCLTSRDTARRRIRT